MPVNREFDGGRRRMANCTLVFGQLETSFQALAMTSGNECALSAAGIQIQQSGAGRSLPEHNHTADRLGCCCIFVSVNGKDRLRTR